MSTSDLPQSPPEGRVLVPQPRGGALATPETANRIAAVGLVGNSFTTETPEIRAMAAKVRETFAQEYPQVDLALPTVELYCHMRAIELILFGLIMEYCVGGRVRTYKRVKMSGPEAVPAYIYQAHQRAADSAAKYAQDLGLDVTGRTRALKDNAIRNALDAEADVRRKLAGTSKRFRRLK